MTIDDLTIRCVPTSFPEGYAGRYNQYIDLLNFAIKERGFNRVLSVRYNEDNLLDKSTLWLSLYRDNVEKMLDILDIEYNPLDNYDRTESTTRENDAHDDSIEYGAQKLTTESGERSSSNEHSTNAFNDGTLAKEFEDSATIEAVTDISTNDARTDTSKYGKQKETVTSHIRGNIGVTTSMQLLESQISLKEKYNQINLIADMWLNDFTVAYDISKF